MVWVFQGAADIRASGCKASASPPSLNPSFFLLFFSSNKWILASIFWVKSMARPKDVGSRILYSAAISGQRPPMNFPMARSSEMFSSGVIISIIVSNIHAPCSLAQALTIAHGGNPPRWCKTVKVTRCSSLPATPLVISCFPIDTIVRHLLQS